METDITRRMVPVIEYLDSLNRVDTQPDGLEENISVLRGHCIFSIPMLEELLSAAKRERDKILNDDIVCLLAEYGMTSCVMSDGTSIGTEVVYETSQKDKDAALLAQWLEEHGYGGVIKDTVALAKGEYDEELEHFLVENGYTFTRDSSVNGQTLKKTLKDHVLAGGDPPPEEAVSLKMFTRGVVKAGKKDKEF